MKLRFSAEKVLNFSFDDDDDAVLKICDDVHLKIQHFIEKEIKVVMQDCNII